MTDTDARYVSMDERSTGDSSDVAASSSGSATQWLSAHRKKVILITIVASVLVVAALGVGYFVMGREPEETPSSSSSSTGGMPYSMSSSTGGGSSGNASVHAACNGLYEWACADWFSRTSIPVNRTSFSRFAEIDVLNNAVLDDILKKGNTGYPLLDTLYTSCMDVDTINELGLKPAQPYLQQLDSVDSWSGFMRLMGEWRTLLGMTMIVAPSLSQTPPTLSSSQVNVTLILDQAPLLLPNRTWYGNATAVAMLQANIGRMFKAAGDSANVAEVNALEVVELEKQLSRMMADSTRNPPRTTVEELMSFSHVHLGSWLEGAQIPLDKVPASLFDVRLGAATLLRALNSTWQNSTKPGVNWKQYARYKMLNAAAPYLSQDIFSAFDYANYPVRQVEDSNTVAVAQVKVKVAVEEEKLSADDARHVVCKRLANNRDIGSDLLGHAFMDRSFNSTAYQLVESMIGDIRSAWTTWLPHLDWLTQDDQGVAQMQKKFDNMQTFIGGPPLLDSYGSVNDSKADAFFNNVLTLRKLHALDQWSTLLAPFDRIRLWNGSPASTVNAYYYSQYNSFYLYAGFFQAPLFFYDDYVANAPWTGEVIGHEAGHGFDANGINYNQNGVRNDPQWLSPAVMKTFRERTGCAMASYSRLQWEGIYVNGTNTIGENMADIIGIRLSYLSYQAWAAKQTKPFSIPANFLPHVETPEQYLMARWAQTECTLETPQALRNQIINDVHAPGFARINGAAQLFQPMAEAFNCPMGSYMNPSADQACFIY